VPLRSVYRSTDYSLPGLAEAPFPLALVSAVLWLWSGSPVEPNRAVLVPRTLAVVCPLATCAGPRLRGVAARRQLWLDVRDLHPTSSLRSRLPTVPPFLRLERYGVRGERGHVVCPPRVNLPQYPTKTPMKRSSSAVGDCRKDRQPQQADARMCSALEFRRADLGKFELSPEVEGCRTARTHPTEGPLWSSSKTWRAGVKLQ
jgi:hypothetical protein